jgi:hypothetical protein
MPLYSVTVKNTGICNGIRVEKGMSVEVVYTGTPLGSSKGQVAVIEAFNRKYGIDIKKAGKLSPSCLVIEKIN